MAQLLSAASAFNPGSDLWILPELTNSSWALRLDWYLNFQILKSTRREGVSRSEPLLGLLKEIDWSPEEYSAAANAPLMISVENRLPARWVVLLPQSTHASHWIPRTVEIWNSLKRPTLKVFLPPGLQAGNFSEEWKRHSDFEDFSLVLDQEVKTQ